MKKTFTILVVFAIFGLSAKAQVWTITMTSNVSGVSFFGSEVPHNAVLNCCPWTDTCSQGQEYCVSSHVICGLTFYYWVINGTNYTNDPQCLFPSSNKTVEAYYTVSCCPTPPAPSCTNITMNSITIAWTSFCAATGYNVQYKLHSSSSWIIACSNTSVMLNMN